ncbi:MAG TPA: hypothetical protein DCZ92_00905 [Elusimicrobia bacterium]|nr:MAG: hypothetical protein A2016_04600 [Elusimicrobia bacterium GWF2_62_30]HBA59385.1 hypothetical protein [Elusimicrobiota bacterium]
MIKTLLLLLAVSPRLYAGAVHHDLAARLAPAANTLAVTDTVTFQEPAAEFVFSLHPGLAPAVKDGVVLELLPPQAAASYGINFSSDALQLDTYRVKPAKPAKSFTLEYSGVINHPLGEQAEEYARSFSETPGLISEKGCYLSGASGWYPLFKDTLVTYDLKTSLPAPYLSVAGGARASHAVSGAGSASAWEAGEPQDEINLVCGKYTEYSRLGPDAQYYAFLLKPDEDLARKYLEAADKYTGFYSELLGAYPYPKFALVENFWETGYGMPSFTLLGPSVIRLPFILNTSYPHEILHNWWGNGVFVDYAKGNWCEGLTTYLADYLIAENRGKGAEYRATTLRKYAAYVGEEKDFPLTEFRSRRSSASEAVGYGKSLMFYHMLRNLLGDEKFKAGLRAFYAGNRFRAASFDELRAAFERQTGRGRLAGFFDQWLNRAGAPQLLLKDIRTDRSDQEYTLVFTLAQTQEGPLYNLAVPVLLYLDGVAEPRRKVLNLSTREEVFHYAVPARILRLEVDPDFDLFRRLDPLESPPALALLLGAKKPAIVLPPGSERPAWAAFAAAWNKDKDNAPLVTEDAAAPAGPYWALGAENPLAAGIEKSLETYGARFSSASVTLGGREFARADHTFVLAAYAGSGPAGLVVSGSTAALSLLTVKLPHYGKYSWLVFDAAMTSVATGLWQAARSPLAAEFVPGVSPARMPGARAPLAPLPSLFSSARLGADVTALAALPGGRGPGSTGLKKAAALITEAFEKAGLKPFQPGPPPPQDKASRKRSYFLAQQGQPANLTGLVQGTAKPEEYLVLAAHYDHLAPVKGLSFPGADDNASGVALLLELARYYAAHPQKRTILFAAFDGEEEGRKGSKAFVERLGPGLRQKLNAALNFDTVGRLGAGKILALGSSSSDKWVHIFRGAGFVTGAEYALVKEDLDASDQASFIEQGVPAVQFFSGANADYHKITDTADKIDLAGLVKQAEFAKEIIDYLAGDAPFITRPSGAAPAKSSAGPARRVTTGLVPDFTYQGEGVRAQAITPGSPLDQAGVKPGSVITELNGRAITGLKDYSEALKLLTPGDKVPLTILDPSPRTIEIVLK